MPLYEYECQQCHRRLEKIQNLKDAPLTECPACGGRLEKLPSAPAIQFKGSGWYITDYARKSGPAPAEKNDKPAAKTGETAPASTPAAESKPTPASATSPAPANNNKDK